MAADISTFHKTEYMNQCFDKSRIFSRKSTFRRHYFGEKGCKLSSEKSNQANQSLLFLLNATCLAEKQQIPVL
jgi:hypothetical protein